MNVNINNRILVVDDNPDIHEDFKKILSQRTKYSENHLDKLDNIMFADNQSASKLDFPIFELHTALQGQEALELVQSAVKEDRPYALAFIDMRMPPGWDGLETIKHLWEADPYLQTVICTAYSDYSWETILNTLGHSDRLLILKKPFDNIEIRLLALSLTKKWMLNRQANLQLNKLQDIIIEQNEKLASALSLTNATLESAAEGIIVFDLDQKVILYNENYLKMWGIPHESLDKTIASELIKLMNDKTQNSKKIPESFNVIINEKKFNNFYELELANGKHYELCIRLQYKNAEIVGLVYCFRDITMHKSLEAELAKQANFDHLTGLPNRSLLADRLQQAITFARRNKKHVAILFVDLDSFKSINDTLGHKVGDDLLKEFSTRLKTCLRDTDTILRMQGMQIDTAGRLGGDEFVIILTMLNDAVKDVTPALGRLVDFLGKPYNLAGHEMTLTVSIGISIYPQDAEDPITLMKNADIAMYKAKEEGKGRYQFYDKSMPEKTLLRMELENDLRYVIERNQLILHYQPLVDVTTHQIVSLETLVRWKHPKLGLISPQEFIPIAELTGLIIPIGNWILKAACMQNKAWQEAGLPKVSIAVNISGRQFKQKNIVELVKNILTETKLEAKYLELELTESVIMNDVNDVVCKIQTLRNIGVKCNIDDFGTGYSSLNYINQFPIDKIKIDKSFIHRLKDNMDSKTMIRAIIMIAKSLNMSIVAEGVETSTQLDIINSLSINEVQGFYLSNPTSAEEIVTILSKKSIWPSSRDQPLF